MISYTKSYKTTDNALFATLDEAKVRELTILFTNPATAVNFATVKDLAEFMLKYKDTLIDILTMEPDPTDRVFKIERKKRSKESDGIEGVAAEESSTPVPTVPVEPILPATQETPQ